MKNYKVPVVIFAVLYSVIGLLNLFYGADAASRFFYFDNLLLRFDGLVLLISGIGLLVKKEIARKGIIAGLILSLIEVAIGVPQNSSAAEVVLGVIFFLILYVPGLLYFAFPESEIWNKIFGRFRRNIKIKDGKESETIESRVRRELSVERRIKSGANWFYWIAGLSIVNSIIFLFDGNINFVAGLGVTQLVDGYAYGFYDYFGAASIVCGAAIELIIAGIFVYFGIMAGRCKKWSFIAGMILYGLDTIIFIVYQDYFGVFFHIFALTFIAKGFVVLNKSWQGEVSTAEVSTLESSYKAD